MSGKVFGVVMLLAALVLAMKIGADFASYEAERSVHIAVVADDQELIDLTPVEPYAYIDSETGKLFVDISENNPKYKDGGKGISPDSVYEFDCMFEVSNHLWEDKAIKVTISSDNEKIQVYSATGQADSTTEFTVDNGESVCVGIKINAEGNVPGDSIQGRLTIHAEPVE